MLTPTESWGGTHLCSVKINHWNGYDSIKSLSCISCLNPPIPPLTTTTKKSLNLSLYLALSLSLSLSRGANPHQLNFFYLFNIVFEWFWKLLSFRNSNPKYCNLENNEAVHSDWWSVKCSLQSCSIILFDLSRKRIFLRMWP